MMLGRVFFKGGIVEEAPLCLARHDVTGEEASGPLYERIVNIYVYVCIDVHSVRIYP